MNNYNPNILKAFGDPTLLEKIPKEENNIGNIKTGIDKINPKSEWMIFNYVGTIQTQAIATKLPKFTFKNKEIETKFNEFLFENNFLKHFQKLEFGLFSNGTYALGLIKNANGIWEVRTGRIIKLEIENLKIKQLTISIDNVNVNNINYEILEEWDLSKNNNYVNNFAKRSNDKFSQFQKISLKEIGISKPDLVNFYKEIPYIIFANRWDEKSEFFYIDKSLFKCLDNDIRFFNYDSWMSAPILLVDSKNKDKFLEAIGGTERVVSQLDINRFLTGNPAQIFQGAPQAQFIIQKIDKMIGWIKDFGIIKKDSSVLGSKNLHTTETQNLNSNFDDSIESKANLREIYLKQFVLVWSKLNDLKLNYNEFEVVVSGSTKWLISEAGMYAGTQDGNTKAFLKQVPKNEGLNDETKE